MKHPTYGGGPGHAILIERQARKEEVASLRKELAALRGGVEAAKAEIQEHIDSLGDIARTKRRESAGESLFLEASVEALRLALLAVEENTGGRRGYRAVVDAGLCPFCGGESGRGVLCDDCALARSRRAT